MLVSLIDMGFVGLVLLALAATTHCEQTRKKQIRCAYGSLEDEHAGGIELRAHDDHAESQFMLASYYEHGLKDHEMSHVKAIYWYARAITNGHDHAHKRISELMMEGRGCEKSVEQALWWMCPPSRDEMVLEAHRIIESRGEE